MLSSCPWPLCFVLYALCRYTKTFATWTNELESLIPGIGAIEDGTGLLAQQSQFWELMNLAYAAHEIVSDYVTASLLWFASE